jgi:peptidoglycan/xylan/chitin deacetylase (PgdA/CDA1 family)
MFNRLRAALRAALQPQAYVLMYHRVAELPTDVWKIAVSPEHFEQQMQLLQRAATVVSVPELVEQLRRRKLKRNSIALTFDDGYADNYLVAKPVLDAYKLPATFFIASGHTDQVCGFWSDELESLILLTPILPATAPDFLALTPESSLALGAACHLTEEERRLHRAWDACAEPPPTRRSALFLSLYQHLQPLAHSEQQQALYHLRQWAGVETDTRPDYGGMSSQQLRSLAAGGLHTLGVHTVSHPALASHSPAVQQQELLDNRAFVEQLSGKPAELVAYPYGIYNHDTLAVAGAMGFSAGFTTRAKPVSHHSDPYQLGRFQVTNLPGLAFAQQLHRWRVR